MLLEDLPVYFAFLTLILHIILKLPSDISVWIDNASKQSTALLRLLLRWLSDQLAFSRMLEVFMYVHWSYFNFNLEWVAIWRPLHGSGGFIWQFNASRLKRKCALLSRTSWSYSSVGNESRNKWELINVQKFYHHFLNCYTRLW